MGMVMQFPAGHRGNPPSSAGSLAASAARSSAVKPEACAVSVERIAHHHSAGIELRSPHFLTASGLARMSDAMAKREGQSPITSLKDLGVVGIPDLIVQSVLRCKSEMSYDLENGLSDTLAMDRKTETEETAEFINRTRTAREAKFETQKPVYKFLGVEQSHYKHWETKRPMPRRYIPKFCLICEVTMDWLLTGEGEGPRVAQIAPKVEKRTSKARRAKAA